MERTVSNFSHEELLDELRRREGVLAAEAPDEVKGASAWTFAPQRLASAEEKERQTELATFDTKDIAEELRAQQKVIYGVDNRLDMYQVTHPAVLRSADSVAALMSASAITDNGDGTSTLNAQTHGDRRNLCTNEPFRDQITPAWCSGFLVDPSFLVTAGHCVNDANLADTRFVFGFEMENATTIATIENDDIYSAIRIIGRQQVGTGQDWAVVQLDRPVLDRPHLPIRRSGKIMDNMAVHVIGHPSGLPKKYAAGATVRDNADASFFVANLDTYGGNSGSPVFDSVSHQVEGVLVRGETDFVLNGTCVVSNVCPLNGCRGEDCTRTTVFDHLVPDARLDCIRFNPRNARVVNVRGRWKIVVGRMWMLDFGTNKAEADKSLSIIKHYGFNGQCFVGRPNPSMEFWLVDGEAPAGPMPGEDAIRFDPARLQVERVGWRWKITEGRHWMMDFGWNQAEARQALSHILRYGFTHMCFVGRPDPSMMYFRK